MSDLSYPRTVISGPTDDRWTDILRAFEAQPTEETTWSAATSTPLDDREVNLNSITNVILDNHVVKYVTLRVYDGIGKQNHKHIVRGYVNPAWNRQSDVLRISQGTDDFVLRRVASELGAAVYDVVGWGRIFHDVSRRSVTFYEEANPARVTVNGQSEQCHWARRLIDEGRYRKGYTTYRMNKNGVFSPESKRRQLKRYEVEFPFAG